MQFSTVVELPNPFPRITHDDELCVMGSCFSEHIGKHLEEAKFRCILNPFGILYNPQSILIALRQIMAGKVYTTSDLFYHDGLYHSYMHHGSFSGNDPAKVLNTINESISRVYNLLPNLSYLILTFGTAWVYKHNERNEVVGNCHKMPAVNFNRFRLSVDRIVSEYELLIDDLIKVNPSLKLIFTVSPIRHIKDGIHGNQLSKSILLLAVAHLRERYPEHVRYFPSYEIQLDELRDYRFYADDMLHPSGMAIEYIWKRFSELSFSTETQTIINACQKIAKDLSHRPLNPHSAAYRAFLNQIVLKINDLLEKYPKLDFRKEAAQCHIQLNQLLK